MENQNLTQEQLLDVETRKEGFKNEYIELIKKYQVDFMPFPQFIQIAQNTYSTTVSMQLADTKYLAIPSPIQHVEGKIIED